MRLMPPTLTPARPPLIEQLAHYPSLNAPAVTNDSTRHMQAMAKRANSSASRDSVLRDYLSGV